jgi:hypothetical protein
LHDTATRFDRDCDRMRIREQRGTRASLGEKCANEARQASIGVAEQQTVPRFPGQERVERLITPGSPVQLGEGSRRYRYLAA